MRTLVRRANESGTDLVFATHDPGQVLAADHVVCLDAGEVTFAGAVSTLYEAPPTAALAVLFVSAPWISDLEFLLIAVVDGLLVATIMLAVAGYEVWSRQTRRLRGWWGYGTGFLSMLLQFFSAV